MCVCCFNHPPLRLDAHTGEMGRYNRSLCRLRSQPDSDKRGAQRQPHRHRGRSAISRGPGTEVERHSVSGGYTGVFVLFG